MPVAWVGVDSAEGMDFAVSVIADEVSTVMVEPRIRQGTYPVAVVAMVDIVSSIWLLIRWVVSIFMPVHNGEVAEAAISMQVGVKPIYPSWRVVNPLGAIVDIHYSI